MAWSGEESYNGNVRKDRKSNYRQLEEGRTEVLLKVKLI